LSGLPAHSRIQSIFETHGPAAEQIGTLTAVLFSGGAVVFGIVLVLTVCALIAPPHWRRRLGRAGFVVGAGIVFPGTVLFSLLVYALVATGEITALRGVEPLRIEVTGEQWWWRVHYLDTTGQPEFATANEIHIPVNRPVEFTLRSADVIHSFWVPNLAGKLDMVPGRVNRLRLRADRTGIFRGQCAEFCGGPHAQMALYVVALSEPDFTRWREVQRSPAPAVTRELQRGKQLFERHGCGSCHAVRGTGAAGVFGPDLTHVGSRLSLGAGLLPVNAGTLAGWTASSQHLKPGNKMPSFNVFSGTDQRMLAAWLVSLQ
jgi:cytochrome c oxidase subunit 2